MSLIITRIDFLCAQLLKRKALDSALNQLFDYKLAQYLDPAIIAVITQIRGTSSTPAKPRCPPRFPRILEAQLSR